ncbi:MAG: acyl-CoA thioesterase [Spirosomataceae bacterium]
MTTSRTVEYSQTTITELMIPSYANFGGKIHGGILLSLMDKVAYACASKHAGAYVVTVSVDEVNFMQPIEVGELLSLHASINYVGKSSMVVGIKVFAENVMTGTKKHTNTSYFTMVAKDAEGKPTQVPALVLGNEDQVRRCLEAINRKRLKQDFQKEFEMERGKLSQKDSRIWLENERVILVDWA